MPDWYIAWWGILCWRINIFIIIKINKDLLYMELTEFVEFSPEVFSFLPSPDRVIMLWEVDLLL